MKLSSFINQINQYYSEIPASDNGKSLEQGLKNGLDAILGKQTGQSISGEVIYRNGSDVILSLGNNQLLQAKLEGSILTEPGQMLTFLIKNNSNNKVVLSPLFENVNQNPNITRALSEAGLPETEATVNMVKSMMEEGLPIDKQSLYRMNRIVNANPQADVLSLVQMQRLNLPITEDSIFQFQAYKNLNHQLADGLSEIMDSFSEPFLLQGEGNNLDLGVRFYTEILELFQEQTDSEIKTDESRNGLKEIDIKQLVSEFKEAQLPEEFVEKIAQNKMSGQDILGEIVNLLKTVKDPIHKEALVKLMDGKAMKSLIHSEMNNQWLLKPEEVAEEKSVDKLYERLNNQINKMNQIISQSIKADAPLAKTVAQVSGNLDFMNQLNQMFTYVQIPLKMNSKEANGELFVYTNKKNLAKKDGAVSALLHLDMENLGSVDVFVSLENQKVQTKFYLQDDSSLDLISKHIELLNQRLEKRGYSMNAEFVMKESEHNVMEEMLNQSKNVSVLAGYSFDARA